MSWLLAACIAMVTGGTVSILSKLGIANTDSDVANAVRTCVVLVFAWIAAAAAGQLHTITQLSTTTWTFLVLSGLATGASWVCYFKALSLGDVNKVMPIDKCSAVMASLMAIVLFQETNNLPLKLASIAVILVGTLLMVQKKEETKAAPEEEGAAAPAGNRAWLVYAVLSAVFAALTSVLAKVGITGVESNLGTAIRTCVVLLMAWSIVVGKGKLPLVRQIPRRELGFLVAAGVATGVTWLLYFYAIQVGVVSVVVQIDKMSILVAMLFARIVLGERFTRRSALGLALLTAGTVAMALFP